MCPLSSTRLHQKSPCTPQTPPTSERLTSSSPWQRTPASTRAGQYSSHVKWQKKMDDKKFKCLQCYKYICNHQWCWFQIMRSVVPSPLGAETSWKGLFERGPDQVCWWSVQHPAEHLRQAGLHWSLHTTWPQVVEIQGHLWHGVLSPSDPWGSKQSSHPHVRQCGQ